MGKHATITSQLFNLQKVNATHTYNNQYNWISETDNVDNTSESDMRTELQIQQQKDNPTKFIEGQKPTEIKA